MKALSIRQPWASLIVLAGKDIENRVWSTNYRGPVLIHAAAKKSRAELEAAVNFVRVRKIQLPPPFTSWSDLPHGGVIGVAEITDCVQRSESPWFTGPHGFVLTKIRPIGFQPRAGQLGLFELHDIDLAAAGTQPLQSELFQHTTS